MKNIVRIISISVVCLLLMGCVDGQKIVDGGATISSDAEVNVEIRQPILGFVSYDEYLSYMQTNEMPSHFVYYDSVSHFGEFGAFIGNYDALVHNVFERYLYRFYDSNGKRYYLTIDHQPGIDYSTYDVVESVNPENMRVINTDDSCVYIISGIYYVYYNSKLDSIVWYVDDTSYSLSEVGEYPVDSSVVGQLLNIEGKSGEELFALLNGDIGE